MVTNLLNSREQIHQSYLVQHFTIFDAWKLDRAAPYAPGAPHLNLIEGLAANQHQGFGMIYNTIQAQASLMAYNDIYRMMAILAACFVPAFMLLRKFKAGGGPAH
jgi:MFS transporter, DHA2 family, multidrug resistance protein